jgi:hypothetical protein
LDLLQLATCNVAKTGARSTEVVWCQLRQAKLHRVVFNNMPHHSVGYEISPSLPSSANTPKELSAGDARRSQPIVDGLLYPTRDRDSANVPTFSCQVNYGPKVFPTLQIIHLQFGQFASAQSAGQKY